MKKIALTLLIFIAVQLVFAQKVPVAKIGDMEFMLFIHGKSKKYSVKKKIKEEQIVYVRVFLDEKGNQIDRKIMKSTDDNLNNIALKYVESYKEGWIVDEDSSPDERSFVMPVIFSTKLNIDNQ